ncbi:hypothetical protein RUM43_002888 [Polyplax serrata]|uniref:Uncharacterized protein n=1 Tax=Polyplax serrata TaxID=468196 RepID=A0AAN8P066_POLSC
MAVGNMLNVVSGVNLGTRPIHRFAGLDVFPISENKEFKKWDCPVGEMGATLPCQCREINHSSEGEEESSRVQLSRESWKKNRWRNRRADCSIALMLFDCVTCSVFNRNENLPPINSPYFFSHPKNKEHFPNPYIGRMPTPTGKTPAHAH